MNAKQFSKRIRYIAMGALATALFLSFVFSAPTSAAGVNFGLETFIQQVKNGQAEQLRGVYVPSALALSVEQQPKDDPRYISKGASVVTQFAMAAKLNNIGLLAHNTLAGAQFSKLVKGAEVTLVYGDGRVESFVVTEILNFQSLGGGKYLNLSTQAVLDSGDLFYAVYGGTRHLTFQTCISKDGNNEWGRMFIIAQPVTK